MKKILISILALFMIAGCQKDKKKILSVRLDISVLELRVADTYQLYLLYEPAELPAPQLLWTSSNEGVVTVSGSGLVSAVGEGAATIIVTAHETQLSASCTITVLKELATEIVLDQSRLTLYIGENNTLHFTLIPVGSMLISSMWSSSCEEVAIVDQFGKVTAVSVGEAVITLFDQERLEVLASCSVEVIRPTATAILLNETELTLQVREIGSLSFSSYPQFSLIENVFWRSSNESVATVDSGGFIKAESEGIAYITVSDASNSNVNAVCVVTVISIILTNISFESEREELYVGEMIHLHYTLHPEGAILFQQEWNSQDPGVASVDQNGAVTGLNPGTSVITLSDREYPQLSAMCTIKVLPIEVSSIQINQTTLSMVVQEQVTLIHRIDPQNATDQEVVWSSDNDRVATVNNNGTVTARGEGTCNVTVKLKNGALYSSCQVVVLVPVSSISVNRNTLDMKYGDSFLLNVSYSPSQAAPPASYYWTSSDEWVASVTQEGRVNALRVGTATIGVETPSGHSATCVVTVNPVYNSWKEPVLLFGGRPLEVIYGDPRSINSSLTSATSGQAMVYDGEAGSGLRYCVYAFDSGVLAAAVLAFADDNQTAINAARGFCAERYKFISESNGISVYQDKNGVHIEVGFRNLTEYLPVTSMELLMLGLKNRWFIISYAK